MLVDTPVVIIGGFGLGNFGDDLLMLAAVNAVRKVHDPTDITVLIYRGGERYCRRLDAMPQYVVRQAETTVRSQVAIYGGGTQFYDFQGTSLRRSRWERAQRFLEGLASGRGGGDDELYILDNFSRWHDICDKKPRSCV